MTYFAAAYLIIWLILFVFIFLMNRRLGALEDELLMLEEAVKQPK